MLQSHQEKQLLSRLQGYYAEIWLQHFSNQFLRDGEDGFVILNVSVIDQRHFNIAPVGHGKGLPALGKAFCSCCLRLRSAKFRIKSGVVLPQSDSVLPLLELLTVIQRLLQQRMKLVKFVIFLIRIKSAVVSHPQHLGYRGVISFQRKDNDHKAEKRAYRDRRKQAGGLL